MHPIVEQQILNLFAGRTHITPIECGPAIGWNGQTVYHHTCKDDFPIKQVIVGGRKKISIHDYIDFVLNGPNTETKSVDAHFVVMPRRGRLSNKAKAEACNADMNAGGDHA